MLNRSLSSDLCQNSGHRLPLMETFRLLNDSNRGVILFLVNRMHIERRCSHPSLSTQSGCLSIALDLLICHVLFLSTHLDTISSELIKLESVQIVLDLLLGELAFVLFFTCICGVSNI